MIDYKTEIGDFLIGVAVISITAGVLIFVNPFGGLLRVFNYVFSGEENLRQVNNYALFGGVWLPSVLILAFVVFHKNDKRNPGTGENQGADQK